MSFRPENIIPGIILCFIFELLLDLSKPTKTLSKKKNFLPGKLQERDFVSTNAEQDLKMTVKILLIVEARGFEPNIVMLNVLINAFGIAGRHEEALSIYHHIRECEPFMVGMIIRNGISPNVIAYSTVMKAFIRAKKFDK
ncbi:Pentatricopeptide repeat - like 10, partial [Theobroma cacao]